MYALGDIRFKKPVSLKKAAYTLGFFIVWTLPIFLIFGFQISPVYLAIALVPPVVLGNFAGKPVWGGKPLFDFLKTLSNFLKEPKGWMDLNGNNMKENVMYVETEVWVSRRRELLLLANMEEIEIQKRQQASGKKAKRRIKK